MAVSQQAEVLSVACRGAAEQGRWPREGPTRNKVVARATKCDVDDQHNWFAVSIATLGCNKEATYSDDKNVGYVSS